MVRDSPLDICLHWGWTVCGCRCRNLPQGHSSCRWNCWTKNRRKAEKYPAISSLGPL